MPEVEDKISNGSLSLSNAAQVQGFLQSEACHAKSEGESELSQKEKQEVIEKIEGSSSKNCGRVLAELAKAPPKEVESDRPIKGKKTQIQFVADKELMAKLTRLKELTSHKNSAGRWDELFLQLAELGLEKLDPQRRQARREKRQSVKSESLPTSEVSSVADRALGDCQSQEPSEEKLNETAKSGKPSPRAVPRAIRDRIWLKYNGACGYVDPVTKKRCGSRKRIEVDHRKPWALGGTSEVGNLMLLCQQHNLQYGQDCYGHRKMQPFRLGTTRSASVR